MQNIKINNEEFKIKRSQNKITLDDIIDLTVVELYILNFLVRIGGNAVRFSVFNELNARLNQSKISRSSFYNSLQKLENKGFVVVSENPKGKGSTVSATSLAREAIKQNNIFSIWGNIDLQQITFQMVKHLADKLEPSNVNKQILATFDELDNIESLRMLEQSSKSTYILSNEQVYEKYNSRGLEYPQSRFEDGIIREPNDFFDRGIISKYHTSAELFGVAAKELLKEIVRVVKPGRYVILTSFDTFPTTNNLILDSIMSDLLISPYFTPSTKESIEKDMNEAEIEDIEFIIKKGYIVAIGKIPT